MSGASADRFYDEARRMVVNCENELGNGTLIIAIAYALGKAAAAAYADGYARGAKDMRERAAMCSTSGGLSGGPLAASIADTIRELPLVKP